MKQVLFPGKACSYYSVIFFQPIFVVVFPWLNKLSASFSWRLSVTEPQTLPPVPQASVKTLQIESPQFHFRRKAAVVTLPSSHLGPLFCFTLRIPARLSLCCSSYFLNSTVFFLVYNGAHTTAACRERVCVGDKSFLMPYMSETIFGLPSHLVNSLVAVDF